jgi:5-methylcytosine-specific restriction protein A
MPTRPKQLKSSRISWIKTNDPPRIRGRKLQYLRKRLFENEPLCVICEAHGKVTVATQRDHVVPLARGGQDTPDNTQALCDACHEEKSKRDRRGSWNGY